MDGDQNHDRAWANACLSVVCSLAIRLCKFVPVGKFLRPVIDARLDGRGDNLDGRLFR